MSYIDWTEYHAAGICFCGTPFTIPCTKNGVWSQMITCSRCGRWLPLGLTLKVKEGSAFVIDWKREGF